MGLDCGPVNREVLDSMETMEGGQPRLTRGMFDGNNNGMTITIDVAGRLVIPKSIREEAGLVPGEPLEITVHGGRIEIVPAPRQVRITDRDGFRVAEPAEAYGTLDERTVRKTRDHLRDNRKPR